MKFVHNDYTLHTSEELIQSNSCILKRIISETKSGQNIQLEPFLDHTAIKYLFENLLLYPYFQPKEYNSFNELMIHLNVETLRPIIEYYQMEKVVILLRDLLDMKPNFCIEELKTFFALKKYFAIQLPVRQNYLLGYKKIL